MSPCTNVMVPSAWAAVLACGAGAAPLQLVDDPSLGAFADVEGLGGVPVEVANDGEVALATFPGNFVLRPGLIVVGQNGGAGFGQMTVSDLEPENQPIPSQRAFLGTQAALVMWDDIDDKEGEVLYVQLVKHPELGDRRIVQWNWFNFDGAGSTLRSQVQVLDNFEPTGVYAQFAYEIEGPATSAGASATIGYQDGAAGFGDIQYSFNTPGAVGTGTVISLLIPAPGDVDADGKVGIVDFLLLIASWGPCAECGAPRGCPADLDGDCAVGIADLLLLLEAWDYG